MPCRARPRTRWSAAAPFALAVAGCYPNARWYEPVTAEKTRGSYAELQATGIVREGPHTTVGVSFRPSQDDVATGRPRLTSPDSPPCKSGVPAETWGYSLTEQPTPLEPGRHGTLAAQLSNARADRDGLLLTRPTVLDVPVTMFATTGPPEQQCLRLPVLVATNGAPEWRQAPRWWMGLELRVEVPFHRISGIGGTAIAPMALGAFVGPMRVGLEFGFGVGFGPGDPRTQSKGAGIFEGGVRLDSPLLVIGRFGTGVKLAYELEGWSFGTDATTNQPLSATVHGPRAALRFLLLPPQPPSSKYDARPDTWSTGIELSGSLLYLAGDGTPTAALGASYFGDIGW